MEDGNCNRFDCSDDEVGMISRAKMSGSTGPAEVGIFHPVHLNVSHSKLAL